MSSMFKFASNTFIAGGTFTIDHSVHHNGIREGSTLLHRATATAAFHNSDERFDPPKCHPKTRLAVLSKIMEWIKWEGDLHTFVMWVYGPAGAGKSAIAQTIAEMCEEEMILLASFFFSRNDPSRSSVKPLIATIAYQITLNLPGVRDAIFRAVERDPLIFSKSLTAQLKSLIVEPLQHLVEVGFFDQPTSRRLVIIDGLDECSDPKVQHYIVDVLANAQREYRLPLIFLFASRPQQHISLAFSTGVLPSVTTSIALDKTYLPEEDIELFLTEKFEEIKSTHRLRAYIPSQWPLPDVMKRLVKKSSGQFIYASTVIKFVSSIRHKPQDRLDIVLGIRPPLKDLPFAELDALYMRILSGVEDTDSVLEIFSLIFLSPSYSSWRSPEIEEFLLMQSGDVELYIGDLNSLVNVEPDQYVRVLHASLTDFLLDPTRSKGFWINPRARHTVFARRCLQLLQLKGMLLKEPIRSVCYSFYEAIYHWENAAITSELHDDLIKFSLEDLQDALKAHKSRFGESLSVLCFMPAFLSGLKKLPLSDSDHISQNLQADFDKILRNTLEKYHQAPGFALLLGSLLRCMKKDNIRVLHSSLVTGLVASSYLGRQRGEGHILDDTGFSGYLSSSSGVSARDRGTEEFFIYFAELLENPERSETRVFDRHRYATASRECLQLCLCNQQNFSKGPTESAHQDKVLRRNRPWLWRGRLGVHSKIRKGRHRLKVRRQKLLKAQIEIKQHKPFPTNTPEHEYCRSLSYRWALDLLLFFLENSAVSLELADVLSSCTFTTMAQRFPRRVRLAKDAMAKYILRVESEAGDP